MKFKLLFIFYFLSSFLFGQARLVLNDDIWLVLDSSFIVIDNPNNDAISTLGLGGNISSEGEFNRIRWHIGTSMGNYIVPFTSPSGIKIPITYNVTSPGIGDGSVIFSTYNWGSTIPSWNNYQYMPSDVSHMGFPDGSNQSIDRFWIIDTQYSGYSYITNPSASLSFVYDRGEVTLGNIINSNDQLSAQRFNNLNNSWGDYLPPPGLFVLNSPTIFQNEIMGISIPNNQFFRSWTLSNISQPLPIELISFKAECGDDNIILKWTTASETNNDYFTVERSDDGVNFQRVDDVDGAGNSVGPIEYYFVDNINGNYYYRLSQTDFNGQTSFSEVISINCLDNGIQLINAWVNDESIQIEVNNELLSNFDIRILDMSGKVVLFTNRGIQKGRSIIRVAGGSIADGCYIINLSNELNSISRKMVINNL